MMTLLAVAFSLLAIALAVAALRMQNKLEESMDAAIRSLRAELQALRDAQAAQAVRRAEAVLSPAEREATVIR